MADDKNKIGKARDLLEVIRDWSREFFVKKVTGKDLSTNDFTNDYKNKVDNSVIDEDYVHIVCSLDEPS